MTQPILYAVLLTAGAVVAIGVGGGLIKPMQDRWERMLNAAERETNTQVAAYQQGRADAMGAPRQGGPAAAAPQPAPAGGPASGYQPGAGGSGSGFSDQPGSGGQGSGEPQTGGDSPAGGGSRESSGPQGPGDPPDPGRGFGHDPGE